MQSTNHQRSEITIETIFQQVCSQSPLAPTCLNILENVVNSGEQSGRDKVAALLAQAALQNAEAAYNAIGPLNELAESLHNKSTDAYIKIEKWLERQAIKNYNTQKAISNSTSPVQQPPPPLEENFSRPNLLLSGNASK
jgi:hypothetical protein